MFKNAACASFARASLATVLGGAAILLWSSALFAAEQTKTDTKKESGDEELTEVQVTGTRIQSPNVTAANPVTTVTGEEMRRLGIVNVADALTQLIPQNISTYMPTLTGDDQAGRGGGGMEGLDRGSFFIGATIANLRGLDPTYGSRTLTLVDGRRVVSTSNQADVVDMNTIPSNLLERMDVVTGGASATYGSGAVAGVVNLVLNRRLNGINLDMDYGVNEAGDGSNPHMSLSGGTTLFGGKGHLLLSFEWRNQAAIRDCAAARDWCAESRALFSNTTGTSTAATAALTPLPGFEGLPARFEMENVRYSQFSPTGTIYYADTNVTSDYRFSADGTGATEYALGYRGGGGGNVINGDGPLVTSGTTLTPSNDTKTFFSNFEYDITPTTTAYVQGNYSTTDSLNRNRYTSGTYCTRFDATGTRGNNAPAQSLWTFGTTFGTVSGGTAYAPARTAQLNTAPLADAVARFLGLQFLPGTTTTNTAGPVFAATSYVSGGYNPFTNVNGGNATPGIAWPFWVPVQLSPNPPVFNFGGNAVGHWLRFKFTNYDPSTAVVPATTTNFAAGPVGGPIWNNDFWILDTVLLTTAFDSGTATVLPQQGRNSYAFLSNLSPDALLQVQNGFNNSTSTGGGAGVDTLYGATPCNGYTAIRKVWNPQLQQETSSKNDTWRAVAGVRGRFSSDWRWEAYYQYGANSSDNLQTNVATNLRLAFAMDAVIDDRVGSATYGTPICRITRDGPPVLDTVGRPLSTPESLAALAAGCKPINIFGTTYSHTASFNDLQGNPYAVNGAPVTYDAAALQQQALAYAFVPSESSGGNTAQTLSLTSNGTLWQGWAGPLNAAVGLEFRQDTVTQDASAGDSYLRSDLARVWSDAFGGRTRVAEGYTELNMPIVSGQDGISLLSVDAAIRYGIYNNKGGKGTTGQSNTQTTPNWKFSAEFSPFDWVRFRMTRSEDLRTAGYRDLFIFQPGIPDQLPIRNPWRDRTATSTENQNERYGQVQVGNPDLKPEKSNTLTLGLVLSPGGWAQGMRFSVDYSNTRVKDGINLPFNANSPVQTCWTQSGNKEDTYVDGEITTPGVNGLFDPNNIYCQQIRFAELKDANGNPIAGSRDLSDVVSYDSARPQNSLPYQRRSVDFTWSYNFPLNRAVEGLPGSMALNARATRALESSGVQQTSTFGGTPLNTQACGAKYELADPQNYTLTGTFQRLNVYNCVDLVGQIRSSTYIPGVAATPKWSGNLSASYLYGNLTTTVSARYTGAANFDNTWIDDPTAPGYYTASGQLTNATVDNNRVDPYVNFSLNGSYNLKVANMKQFQIFGTVNNLFDKTPPFTGGGISGATAGFSDTLGRAYRMGVRLRF